MQLSVFLFSPANQRIKPRAEENKGGGSWQAFKPAGGRAARVPRGRFRPPRAAPLIFFRPGL
ncbi:MAG: hypothetical protein DBY09_01615 [Selenomonadales bacterium]|nr:MAG: hypothetical protein DBY09_01615 [Selenomonadales bacterium]